MLKCFTEKKKTEQKSYFKELKQNAIYKICISEIKDTTATVKSAANLTYTYKSMVKENN